jgi:hypothetical protein
MSETNTQQSVKTTHLSQNIFDTKPAKNRLLSFAVQLCIQLSSKILGNTVNGC